MPEVPCTVGVSPAPREARGPQFRSKTLGLRPIASPLTHLKPQCVGPATLLAATTCGGYKSGYKGRKWGYKGPKLGYKQNKAGARSTPTYIYLYLNLGPA